MAANDFSARRPMRMLPVGAAAVLCLAITGCYPSRELAARSAPPTVGCPHPACPPCGDPRPCEPRPSDTPGFPGDVSGFPGGA